MKKIIIVLLFAGTIFGQNHWQVIKEATIETFAEPGYFFDENNGWLYGDNGAIYYTQDGGVSWQIQRDTSSAYSDINNIYFYDSTHGWACGEDGTVLYTTDGGVNWLQSDSTSTSEHLEGINFVSTTIGYACGDEGVIIRSNDGGITWILLTTPTASDLNDISFFDANNGFAVFGTDISNVLWTNSGGFLWSLKPFTKPSGQANVRMYDCKAVRGTNHAWMIGYHGNIFHSTNKGQNWALSKSILGTSNGYARAIDFIDANTGYAGADYGLVFRTTDSGASWDSVLIGTGERIHDLNAIDANTIIAVGESNQLRKSIDGGNTWVPIIDWPWATFRAIGVADSLNITCCTFGGDLTHSNNAGNNFSFPNNENLPITGSIFCVDFYNANLGFYGASGGEIAKSVDGGATWYKANVTGANELRRIQTFFIYNQDIAWAGAGKGSGIHGRIYKTTDGGENWNEVAALDEIIYGVYFFDDQIGYAVGEYGKIYKCTDGNTSWTIIDSVGENDLTDIDFIDSQTGYVVGYNGILGKTTDGGNNWDVIDTLGYINDSTAIDELYDIEFVSSTEGWIGVGNYIGENGAFYHTTDAGNTWQKYDSPNGRTVRGLKFISPSYGWAAGAEGSIFKYDAATGFGQNSPAGKIQSFSLYSNYPNPFNPVTNIKYYLNISGDAELSIYNIHGQKIRTLINEYQTPGNYNFTWDGKNEIGSQVSTGTYFYQLKIDNEVHAKRMVLLK